MHRAGYHFRRTIVDEARKMLERNGVNLLATVSSTGEPESIPTSQEEINKQADAVLRDLFPRIPNTDRQEIILHAFQKVCGTPFQYYYTHRAHLNFLCEFRTASSTANIKLAWPWSCHWLVVSSLLP